METIRNYLETMFSGLADTPEVLRAKDELGQMMEDKYTELIREGKTENEAIGTVISEFGNLNELAGDLGIGQAMRQHADDGESVPGAEDDILQNQHTDTKYEVPRREVTIEEAMAYLTDKGRAGVWIGLGVMLCILSPVPVILLNGVLHSEAGDAAGVILLLFLVAAAVGIFVYTGVGMEEWEFLKQEPCQLDGTAQDSVSEQKKLAKPADTILMTGGIVLLILSAMPALLISFIARENEMLDNLSGVLVLVFVAVGVGLIIFTGVREEGYRVLLRLGERSGNGNSADQSNQKYHSRRIRVIMSVYWPTVTCIYLALSFLTFRWDITWLIWPIAAILSNLLRAFDKEKEQT